MRIHKYLKTCNQIYHLTLDPKEESVIRIHLIPPKKLRLNIPWVVILNGFYILPLQTGWAILLKEFIETVNADAGKFKSINHYVDIAATNDLKVFPKAPNKLLKKDLKEILGTFRSIVRKENVSSEIGLMTFKDYQKFMSAPHRMDLMISSMEKNGCWNCNQKCLHCYASGEKLSKVCELSTNEWKKIIDVLKDSKVPQITFTGGEPTIRDDLVELVDYSKWFVTRLNTNGILLTESLCKELYDASLDSVQITFYSNVKDLHNMLVGGLHFDKTVEGIKNAIKANLDVSCNTPLCSINMNYIDTIRFLKDLGVKYFSASGLIPSGNAKSENSEITKLSKEEITSIIKKAYKYCKDNDLELTFTSPGWIDEKDLTKMKMVTPSCGAGLSNMAIAPNGEVIPCQSWLFEDGLGNILDTKWEKIWNHPNCKKRREFSSKNSQVCPLGMVK